MFLFWLLFGIMDNDKCYIAIDLKSFYASVECMDRGLDPLTTNLVVADPSRTEKTICLAVTPSLKAYGISGRARLFEVVERVKEVNRERLNLAVRRGKAEKDESGEYHFRSSSSDANALAADESLELSYIVAPPRMRMYEEISGKIFSIYLKYVSAQDIHVYSIDEVFIDVTAYLQTYRMTAKELCIQMIRDVLKSTGITATAGIGSNLYLAKVAMDIVAKHVPANEDGVRIAELNEISYRELLWCHRPLTDFWRVGRGISKRLEKIGVFTMGDIAALSLTNEDILYSTFGINAELLIDHAWGWEPATIEEIKSYRPEHNSLSSGQVLSTPYEYDKGLLIVKEMMQSLALDLVRKDYFTRLITLTINYDRESLVIEKDGRTWKDCTYHVALTGRPFTGEVALDYYGRPAPAHAHGSENIDHYTSSATCLVRAAADLYRRIVDPDLLIRRITICACNLLHEDEIPTDEGTQLSLFDLSGNNAGMEIQTDKEKEKADEERERRMQKATLALQEKFGKNVILKGMNLEEGGTAIERNRQIGGHKAE